MGNRVGIRGLIVCLAFFGFLGSAELTAEEWLDPPRFKAHVGNPYTGPADLEQPYAQALLEIPDYAFVPNDSEIRALEDAMSKVAQWYKDHGYPPPRISSFEETDDGGRAYRFYLCTPDTGQALWDSFLREIKLQNFVIAGAPINPQWSLCSEMGAYSSACGEDSRRSGFFYVNYDKALSDQHQISEDQRGIKELGYQTMAHEMMHAVFPGTALGQSAQSCRINGWITEGLADAVGFHIAWELFGKNGLYRKGTSTKTLQKRHGSRPYFVTLAQKRKALIPLGGPGAVNSDATTDVQGDYFTSSFWRFVADSYSSSRGWDILLATGGANRVDVGLLDLPVTEGESGDWKREVEWLDEGLRDIFGFGLDKMYANFVAFYSHSLAPFASIRALNSEEDKLDYWTMRIFETCQTVDISQIGTGTVNVEIDELSSTCVKVEPTGFGGAVQVTFSAEGTDPDFLESLLVSRAGTALLVSGNVVPSATPPATHSVEWRDFPQDGAKATYYLISNVAAKPKDTKPGKAKISITIPGFYSNYGPDPVPSPVAPAPVKPNFNPKAPTHKERKAKTDEMLRKQIEIDKGSLTNRGSVSAEITRHVMVHDCEQPFVYQVCGKHLQISLELRPGMYGQFGTASSQGGMAAQFFGSMMSMSQSSPMSETYIKDLEARLDSVPGSSIQIAIPLIDYGFSGSFSNASISVSVPGDRTWRAIGPPDRNRNTRLTGNVTIEHFSPTILRGSFSGNLAEIIAGPDGRPVYTPREPIHGEFVTVSPWTSDERIPQPQQSHEEVVEDIVNTMGLDQDTVRYLKEQGVIPGQEGSSPGGTVGTVDSDGACSCECEDRHLADELCELFCEEEFAACE